MTTRMLWNDRLLPYPLLAPWNDDYGTARFEVNAPQVILNNGKQISLTVKYHLTSEYLRDLVSKGKARYVSVVMCSKTFIRHAYVSNQEDDVQVLDAGDYQQDLIFTPYVVATQSIAGFISAEHADEYRDFKPEGFDISTAAILAVGNSTRISLEEGGSPFSVIDLVSVPRVENGSFIVDLEDNRIQIQVSAEDYGKLDALRRRDVNSTERAVLFPALFLHAITEALRNLSDLSHQESQWANTMRRALEERGISASDAELEDSALKYAQVLMENPMGKLLMAFTNWEEE